MLGLTSRIHQKLQVKLSPIELTVEDESHFHTGHAGAKEGGHYRIKIVSNQFKGLNRIQKHQLIYSTLKDDFQNGIHALAIQAHTPEEVDSLTKQ